MIIPETIVNYVKTDEDSKRKHYILLALSTMKEDNLGRTSSFAVPDENVIISNCIGQLEPVVKLRLMKNNDHRPLKIIALCTDVVQTKRVNDAYDSTLKYYEYRFLTEFAQEYQTDIEITPLDLDENNPNASIQEVANYIRNNKDEMFDLWIDTHGAFREVSLIMEAVISLLKVDEILPDKVWGVQFGDEPGKNTIVSQYDSFSVFEFVSGMNEFINFGSVDMLYDYYKGREKNDEVQKLLKAMSKVSEGTKECNSIVYEKGLDELGDALERMSNDDSLLSIFKDYVQRDYGVLLDKERRTAIDIIERCYEKGMIQQALTFIESLMPQEYVDTGVLCCDAEILEKCQRTKKQRIELNVKDSYKDDKNYIVDTYCFDQSHGKEWPVKSFFDNKFAEKPFMLNQESRYKVIGEYANGIELGNIIVYTKLKPREYGKAAFLLRLHGQMKRYRNKYNHVDPSQRPSSENIRKLIKKYIDVSKEIICNKDNYSELTENEWREIESNIPKNKKGYKKKTISQNSKKKVDTTVYTFIPKEISKSGKSIRGIIKERNQEALLPQNELITDGVPEINRVYLQQIVDACTEIRVNISGVGSSNNVATVKMAPKLRTEEITEQS